MNKKSWILIIILVVAVIFAFGIFFYFQNTNSSPKEDVYESSRTSSTNTILSQENIDNTTNTTEIRKGIEKARKRAKFSCKRRRNRFFFY